MPDQPLIKPGPGAWLKRYVRASAAVVISATIVVAVSASDEQPAQAAAPSSAVAGASAEVSAAISSGSRVEVMAERTEFVQVFAEPTGRLTYEASAVPQRVQRDDRSWVDIDTRLTEKDGSLRPAATLADVRFSTGGTGPLVTLVRDGKTFTVSWPYGVLPPPVLSEDTASRERESATYREVLSGVDLMVRATPTGFAHVLVVKDANAATSSTLRQLRFVLGGDARVRRLADGSLQALDGDVVFASAAVPQMWDSSDGAAQARALVASEGPAAQPNVKSTHQGPGDLAKTAVLGTEVTADGDLLLRPDTNLLSASAKFPVFIDPDWSTKYSRWAYSTDSNTNNTDTSVARVGKDPDGRIYRSFFEFPIKDLAGTYVHDAYVQMVVDHTWSCDFTPNSMYHTGAFTTPRTTWKPGLGTYLATVSTHANEGTGCSDSPQKDMPANFETDAVTNLVRGLAKKGTSTVGFAFTARDADGSSESDGTRWKKYLPGSAKLIVDKDAIPTAPSWLKVSGVDCNPTDEIHIGTKKPSFSAVLGDADGTKQTLTATWKLVEAPRNAAAISMTAPAAASAAANTRATSEAVKTELVDQKRYAFQVSSKDPYNQVSPNSIWCYFIVDVGAPRITITKTEGPAGPGAPAKFKITSPDTDVRVFRYNWSEAGIHEAPANSVMSGGEVVGKEAEVTLNAPKYGLAIIYGQAIDATNNIGVDSEEVLVPRPKAALARWVLEKYPSRDQSAALIDQQPTLAGDNVLTTSGISWQDEGRLVDTANLTFAGAASLTTPKMVDTTANYSVAAWAKLDDVTVAQTVMSQDGDNTANFQLQYRPDDINGDGTADRSWCFGLRHTDEASTAAYTSVCALNSAAADRWTHVAGTYDATSKRLAIWINGVLKADAAAPAVWNATGPLRIGNRKVTPTTFGEYLRGSVADAQVFDRTLVRNDFTGTQASENDPNSFEEPSILSPVTVGRWTFDAAAPCYETGLADQCEAPDLGTAWDRRLLLTQGTSNFGGGAAQSSFSLDLDNVHFIDDPTDSHYQEITHEYGYSQRNMAPPGEEKDWQDTAVLRTDQSFSVSVWVQPKKLDTAMTAVAQRGTKQSAFYLGTRRSMVAGIEATRFEVMMPSADQDTGEQYTHLIAPQALTATDTDDWFHLRFEYNAASSMQLRLYVDNTLVAAQSGQLWNAAGAFSVGSAWTTPDGQASSFREPWFGLIDEIEVQQGVVGSDWITDNTAGFASGSEPGEPRLTWQNTIAVGAGHGASANVGGVCCSLSGAELVHTNNAPQSPAGGTNAVMYSGKDNNDTRSYAYTKAYDLRHLRIQKESVLSYRIYPQSSATGGTLVSGNNSACVAIDVVYADGKNVRDSGVDDQNGNRAHPANQCGALTMDTWNEVVVPIGLNGAGKQIDSLDIGYDQPANTGGYRGFIDDIKITDTVYAAPLFASGLEAGEPGLTWTSSVSTGDARGSLANVGGVCCSLTGPELIMTNSSPAGAYIGTNSLMYSGKDNNDIRSFAYTRAFQVNNVKVSPSTRLTYRIYPQSTTSSSLVSGNNSTCVAIDLIFTDVAGNQTNLRDSGATDERGNLAHPAYQCAKLTKDTWNEVVVPLGAVAAGKQISQIDIGYDQPGSTGGYRGFIDDIRIFD